MIKPEDQAYQEDTELVRGNWERYQYGKDRGHQDYVETALLNEDYYLGGGLQWTKEDRDYLEAMGRPVIEKNYIFPVVNTAIGMQLESRVDIAFKPRKDGATEESAKVLGQVVMQICDDIKFRWKESQSYEDGLIEQRGFLDFRINFDTNLQGDVECEELDPLDIIIDPDAQGYDPATWQDVIKLRWLTIDDISQLFGEEKGEEVDQVVAGVSITVSQSGGIKASGKQKRVNQLLPIIRSNKAELLRFLQSPPVEPNLKPCPICNGIDFIHGDKGGYYCKVCQLGARPGIFVRAGGNRFRKG